MSIEYGGKYLYGSLIRMGRDASFEEIRLETQVWAEGVSQKAIEQEAEFRVIKPVEGDTAIAAVPRYEAFTQIVPRLVEQGISFVEIAGNDQIVVTVIAPSDHVYEPIDSMTLFSMPILSEPGFIRHTVQVPVQSLHLVIEEVVDAGLVLEHIYDY